MVVILQVNGGNFSYPELDDSDWGIMATAWAAAISTATLQKVGGTFTLTAEVDFGANFGLKSLYFKSRTADSATAGQIRLAREDTLQWRNTANSQNLALAVNGTDRLTFNGVILEEGSERALVGTEGITIISGSSTNTVQGFHSEFVSASGILQTQITAMAVGEIEPAIVGTGGITVSSGSNQTQINSPNLRYLRSDSSLLVVTTGTNDILFSPDTTPSFTSVQATTVTGTTGQFGGTVSAQTGNFSHSLTISGLPVSIGQGGAGTPGGSNTQVQFNDGGAFAGDPTFTFNDGTNTISGSAMEIGGTLSAQNGNFSNILTVSGLPVSVVGSANVLLASYSPSSTASVDITSVLTSEYDHYEIIFKLLPVNDDVRLWLRTSTDNGASFVSAAASYSWHMNIASGATVAGVSNTSDTKISLDNTGGSGGVGNLADEGTFGTITIANIGSATQSFRAHTSEVSTRADGLLVVTQSHGKRLAVGRVNAVRLLFETGNIASGQVAVYGVRM